MLKAPSGTEGQVFIKGRAQIHHLMVTEKVVADRLIEAMHSFNKFNKPKEIEIKLILFPKIVLNK